MTAGAAAAQEPPRAEAPCPDRCAWLRTLVDERPRGIGVARLT